MTAVSVLLLLIGIFILLNASNFVKVIQGKAKINWTGVTGGEGRAIGGSFADDIESTEPSGSPNPGII